MNIPRIILNDRKIISSEVYHYYQSLAQRLISKKKKSDVNIISNYSQEKIKSWFSNLELKQKFKICSIYNKWFSNIIFQMKEYKYFEPVIEFYPTEIYQGFKKNNIYGNNFMKNDLDAITNHDKNFILQNCDNFITFFRAENNTKKAIGVPNNHELINLTAKTHRESLFLAELRFITLDELNDTISFSKDLFDHPERLFELFNFFSNNQCFSSVISPIQEKNNIYNFSFPNWIYNCQSFSFCQILIIFFEQIISVYYQIYLYENNIPQLNIDEKLNDFFRKNENIKNFLSQKIINNNNDDFIIDKDKCYDILCDENQKKKYLYYEGKTKLIYSLAFGSTLYEQNLNFKREFNLQFQNLMEFIKKNSSDFVDEISFIKSKVCFKYSNFIYSVIYQQLLEKCSDECYQELLEEEDNKTHNETITTKTKKNKRKRKKKKKAEKENKETQSQKNNNIEDYNEDEKEKNITDNNEEEIEEIPAVNVINQKTDQNIIESESANNYIMNSNDLNNSTVSSSYTNKYSKDNNNWGVRYNNFFKNEKKEKERPLEKKDFIDDNIEESNVEVEDLSENEINEENTNNEDSSNTQININENNKKKKKKHKKRNKKKKNKDNNNDNNNNDIINNDFNKEDIKEKERKDKINLNCNINLNFNNNKNNPHELNIILKNKDEEKNKNLIKEINKSNKEEKKLNNNDPNKNSKENEKEINEKVKIKEIKNGENEKPKRKQKVFYLYPVITNKNKEKNSQNKKNEKTNLNPIISINKESIFSLNNNNTINEEIKNNKIKEIKNKDNKEDFSKEEKKENNITNLLQIKQVENITINSQTKNKKEKKDNNFLNEINCKESFNNPSFYQNCNNSFLVFQNDLFINLGKNILNFENIVNNNLKEINVYREKIINKFKKFIIDNLSNKYYIKFLFYGSYSTGLSIESSDIDILIKFQKKEEDEENIIDNQKHIHELIFLLNEYFKKYINDLNIEKINPIYTASIPVLKIECLLKDIIPEDIQKRLSENYLFNFENELLKLNFDFTFLEVDDIDKDQIIPSQKIIKFIKDSIIIYPNIKPIILILKRYMQIQKLNSSYHGGISSFSLFLLLASYNKQLFNENKLLDKNKDFENLLGQILYGFFMFYSNFNFEIHSIDLNKNNPFILLEEFNESNITLIDPITGLNAAKSTFKLDQIKFAFNNAILRINEIFFNNINSIKNNNDENNIIKELFTTNNFTNYFY